jgi:hypothetical protein
MKPLIVFRPHAWPFLRSSSIHTIGFQSEMGADIGDAVAAGLVDVEEKCVLDGVHVWASFDVNAALQEDVRRSQNVLSAVERLGHAMNSEYWDDWNEKCSLADQRDDLARLPRTQSCQSSDRRPPAQRHLRASIVPEGPSESASFPVLKGAMVSAKSVLEKMIAAMNRGGDAAILKATHIEMFAKPRPKKKTRVASRPPQSVPRRQGRLVR